MFAVTLRVRGGTALPAASAAGGPQARGGGRWHSTLRAAGLSCWR